MHCRYIAKRRDPGVQFWAVSDGVCCGPKDALEYCEQRAIRTPANPEDTMQLNPSPEVIFREVEDGAVLLSTRDEVYFGLNRVGARVWELLCSPKHELEDLCRVLAEEFPGVGIEMLKADVSELLERLQDLGLVVSRHEAA